MNMKTTFLTNVLFIVLNLISDLPCITFLEAYDRKELNEMSPFRLTCIVNSSTSTNMSIKNKDSGKVMRTGILTDTNTYTNLSQVLSDSGVHLYSNKHRRQHRVKSSQDLSEL